MLQKFRKVSPTLYRSSAPTPEDVIWLNKKVGITRIISLDEAAGKRIDLSCQLLGINHVMLPITMTRISLLRFLDEIGKLLQSSEKTLIHCKYGRDRTGLAVAMYRVQEQGWSPERAIKEARSLDFGKGLNPEVVALYISLIQDSSKKEDLSEVQDVNEASDIVDGSRESYDDYFGSPSENLSWSPYGDRNVREFPMSPMSLNDSEGNPLGQFGPSIVQDGTVI